MNLKFILSKKQKRNLKNHYLKYRNSTMYYFCPLDFHKWLKSYCEPAFFSILMSMANTEVDKYDF